MSDTSVILPQSAISSIGFLLAAICHLWVSRCGPVWTGLDPRGVTCGRDFNA